MCVRTLCPVIDWYHIQGVGKGKGSRRLPSVIATLVRKLEVTEDE